MNSLSQVPDQELLGLVRGLVHTERGSVADVVEHLIEADRRHLYVEEACDSLSSYCIERLRYSADEAGKRVCLTRFALRYPQVLEELRSGAIHMTGLCLLSRHITDENLDELLALARGKSKRAIEALLAARSPKLDVPDWFGPVPEQLANVTLSRPGTGASEIPGVSGTGPTETSDLSEATLAGSRPGTPEMATTKVSGCPGTELPEMSGSSEAKSATIRPGASQSVDAAWSPEKAGTLKPLSASRWSVQFTVTSAVAEKIQKAEALASHALPKGGGLAGLFERAIDALIEKETKRRRGAGKPRTGRP